MIPESLRKKKVKTAEANTQRARIDSKQSSYEIMPYQNMSMD